MSLYFFPTDIYCILYSFQRNHVLKLCRLEIHIGGIYFVKKSSFDLSYINRPFLDIQDVR